MNKKVLGFEKKDAAINTEFYRGVKYCPAYLIEISKLVPVNLKSESVTVKWLEKYCKNNFIAEGYSFVWIQDLLKAVRLQAVEEKE